MPPGVEMIAYADDVALVARSTVTSVWKNYWRKGLKLPQNYSNILD